MPDTKTLAMAGEATDPIREPTIFIFLNQPN